MNKFIDAVTNTAASLGGITLVKNLEARRANLLRILVYHRIGYPGEESGLLDPSLLSATPEQFERQMHYLAQNYRLISIPELLQMIKTQQPLPANSVMITFDDGYQDFLETAWPILERYQVPALMFLSTGYLWPAGQLFWWDRLYQGISKTRVTRLCLPDTGDHPLKDRTKRWQAFIQLKRRISCLENSSALQLVDQILEALEVIPDTSDLVMSWSDARFLNAHGCYLAPHTRNHAILSRITAEAARQEIRGSQEDIYREIGTAWPVLAYPSGHPQDCSEDLSPILHAEGIKLAMTSIPGINVLPECDLLLLKRIGLSPRLNLPEFQLVLTGLYHIYATYQRVALRKD